MKSDPRAEARIGERLPYVGNEIYYHWFRKQIVIQKV